MAIPMRRVSRYLADLEFCLGPVADLSDAGCSAAYDRLPYDGHPDPLIHPDRLAVAAWLANVPAMPPGKARVLEIGCAGGANLIAMADQLPGAEFVGFDFSSRQIELAQTFARAAGLRNIAFHVRDILDPADDLGRFDYIIAHGIYSWVPAEVQQALMRLCTNHLAANGVALVDYNVLPGWRMRALFRDLLCYHQEAGGLLTAATRARDTLHFLSEHLLCGSPAYAHMVQELASWSQQQSGNYLAHEFGSNSVTALRFSEFASHADEAGLQILGDAELVSVIPAALGRPLADELATVAGNDYVRREEYMDCVRGRTFRRTLLVRKETPLSRKLNHEGMRRCWLTTLAKEEAASPFPVFRTPDGGTLQTGSRFLAAAMRAICRAGSVGLSFEALLRWGSSTTNEEMTPESCVESLLEVIAAGFVQVHAVAPQTENVVTQRPEANAVARASAALGNRYVSSLLHRDWQIDEFEQMLLPLLTGSHTHADLVDHLMDAVGRKKLRMPHSAPLAQDVRQQITEHLSLSLEWFARVGILCRSALP